MRLFIDDIRDPEGDWIVVRSSSEAVKWVEENGMPESMSLDHDLGGEDTVMVFLKKLYEFAEKKGVGPPPYKVHSANPVGSKNIVSFMESWRRSLS
jgi:hypothetical protein